MCLFFIDGVALLPLYAAILRKLVAKALFKPFKFNEEAALCDNSLFRLQLCKISFIFYHLSILHRKQLFPYITMAPICRNVNLPKAEHDDNQFTFFSSAPV